MEDRSQALRAFALRLHEAIYSAECGNTNPDRLAEEIGAPVHGSTIRSWLRYAEAPADGDDGEEEDAAPSRSKSPPKEPSIYRLALVAERLNVSVDWLLFGQDRRAVDVALLRKLRSVRKMKEEPLTKELGSQLADDLVPWPLASELARDVQLVTDEEHKAIDDEVRSILSRAPSLMRELQELQHRWKELRKRFPPTRTQRP